VRRILSLLPLVLLAGCVAPAPAPTTPAAATSATPAALPTATVGLSYIPNVQFAPFYVAASDGAFTTAGVAATLRHHGSSEGLFTAITAGQEDFVIAGGDEALQARENGVDLVSVGTYYASYPVQVLVPEQSEITDLADLKGARIGVPGRYGESWFGLLVALRTAGLTEADVEVVEVGYTQQAALAGGKVDAVIGFSNNDAVQFGLAGVDVRGLPLTAAGSPPLVSISLLTTRAYLDAHPETVRAVAQGMVAGINAVAADPARAVTLTAAQVPGMDATAARATLDATIGVMLGGSSQADGHVDADQWQQMADFMLAQGLLTKPADVAAATAPDVLGS
jgi:NitT/TauT family transport system substrate-binding protein